MLGHDLKISMKSVQNIDEKSTKKMGYRFIEIIMAQGILAVTAVIVVCPRQTAVTAHLSTKQLLGSTAVQTILHNTYKSSFMGVM